MLFQRNPNLNAIAEDTDDNIKSDFQIGEELVSNNDSTIEFVSNNKLQFKNLLLLLLNLFMLRRKLFEIKHAASNRTLIIMATF